MNNILVTGGTGMVGSHLREIAPEWKYLGTQDCDLTNYESVSSLVRSENPDRIIHLAAKVGGILQNISEPADFYDKNILINTNILIASKNHNVPRFTATLSTCMYPDISETYPLKEADIHNGPPSEANFSYGYSKRCMAVQIEAYKKQHGLKYNYVIPCNMYGENDNFDNLNKSHFITALIKKIIDAEREGKNKITLFGTGRPLRQFMHARDLAKAIKLIVDNDITESFNIAPPNQNYSIDRMAKIALSVLNKAGWTIEYDSDKPDGQFRKDIDCKKLITNLKDFSFTSFEDGVLGVYERTKAKIGDM